MRRLLPTAVAVFLSLSTPVFANPLGWGADPSTAAADDPFVYVGNRDSGDVVILDRATDKIIQRISQIPTPHMLSVTPDRRYLLVTSTKGNAVALIERPGSPRGVHRLIRLIPVGLKPEHMNFSPDGKLAFVANHGDATVSVISLQDFSVAATLPVGKEPENITFSPDGARAFVAGAGSYELTVIETKTLRQLGSIPLGGGPAAAALRRQKNRDPVGAGIVAIHPGGRLAFAAHADGGQLYPIDLAGDFRSPLPLSPIFAGDGARQPTLSPDGKTLLIASDGRLGVFDTMRISMKALIPLAGDITGIIFSPSSDRAYLVNRGRGAITVVDPIASRVIAEIPVGKGPEVAALSPDGKTLYVANGQENSLAIVELSGGESSPRVRRIDGIGKFPWAVEIAGGGNFCH